MDDKGSKASGTEKRGSKELPQDHVDEDEDDAGAEQEVSDDTEGGDNGQEENAEEFNGENSHYDTLSSVNNDGEAAEKIMDLLGVERNWEKVLESARTVREYDVRLQTETIRNLLLDIRRAKSTYKQLASLDETDKDSVVTLEKQLHDELEAIEEQVEDIAEANAGKKKSGMIRDIFAHAIPAMIFLLEAALSLRTSQPRGLHRFSALQEVVRLQGMVLRLCIKAKAWKTKPITGHPIKKPTVSVIYPYIRDMREGVFATELKSLKRVEKVKQNALKTKEREQEHLQREAATLSQQATQRCLDSPTELGKHIAEEKERLLNRRKWRVIPIIENAPVLNDQTVKQRKTAKPHEWTNEQVIELTVQLGKSAHLRGEIRKLTSRNSADCPSRRNALDLYPR